MSASRRIARLLIAAVTLSCLTGCVVVIDGTPRAEGGLSIGSDVDTSVISGSDGGRIDQLAAATVTDVQAFWRETFDSTFDQPWRDIKAFFSVDTRDTSTTPPPCAEQASDVEGNAFYCSAADAIAYDRAALFPVLAERYGEAAVVLVLAHEIGHAVHTRLGVDNKAQREQPQLYPTIVTESMADCYAGAVLRWIRDGKARHLSVDSDQLDLALGSLVSFRDPIGTSASDGQAHGNAFDRVSSFQDGFQQGPKLCSEITTRNRPFTLREFTSAADESRGGDLALPELLRTILPDLDEAFQRLVSSAGGTWRKPDAAEDADCSGEQGPVAYCPDNNTVAVETGSRELVQLHDTGDYTVGTLIASRYGLAALAALGRPVEGEEAGRTALCLAGAYTADLLDRGDRLSPGDLDEAVLLLLQSDYPMRDAQGDVADSTGFDRVDLFRAGTLEGAEACG